MIGILWLWPLTVFTLIFTQSMALRVALLLYLAYILSPIGQKAMSDVSWKAPMRG